MLFSQILMLLVSIDVHNSVTVSCALKSVEKKLLYYDSFCETLLTDEELEKHRKDNTTIWCVNEIEPCDPEEGRRIDGSCNNLNHPIRGATHTPFYRLLPAEYSKDFEPRKSKSGQDLPLSRYLRTSLLSEGRVTDQRFTQLLSYFMVFMAADVTGPHDTVNYIHWKTHCCELKGKTDKECIPNLIPADDPVHRFSDIRCMNLTRPISFQSVGCIKNDTPPERLDTSTPLLDLSTVYGKDLNETYKLARHFEGGLLKYEVENGRVWPPSTKSKSNFCYGNQKPFETRCHAIPSTEVNALLGVNLVTIWFWRHHNYIAKNLQEINPCWSDEKLFYTARDINIAMALQIYYYELMATFMGKENLLRDGVLSRSPGFRDEYDETVVPQRSVEYPFVLRWVHTIQEGIVKMYDSKGNYMKQLAIVNLTLRTGYLALDNNIDYLTQGSFRQGGAKFDHIVDPELAESGLAGFQKAADVFTSDLSKNRYFGYAPYVKYRELCFGKRYEKFEDLSDAISSEGIERLRDVYQDIEDIDILAGIWLENPIEGGSVPSTFYCIVTEQMRRYVVSDRHWYERSGRPDAFTMEQLLEIRKTTMSHVLCAVGDGVNRVQTNSFLRVHPETNRMGSCTELAEIDFWAWEDFTFECEEERNKNKKGTDDRKTTKGY